MKGNKNSKNRAKFTQFKTVANGRGSVHPFITEPRPLGSGGESSYLVKIINQKMLFIAL